MTLRTRFHSIRLHSNTDRQCWSIIKGDNVTYICVAFRHIFELRVSKYQLPVQKITALIILKSAPLQTVQYCISAQFCNEKLQKAQHWHKDVMWPWPRPLVREFVILKLILHLASQITKFENSSFNHSRHILRGVKCYNWSHGPDCTHLGNSWSSQC